MTDNHTPVAPHDCISGLVYTHNRANANIGELHLDREICGCTVYEQRPIPCRGYDCQDVLIWLDFGNKVVNPRVNEPNWPACLETETKSVTNGKR